MPIKHVLTVRNDICGMRKRIDIAITLALINRYAHTELLKKSVLKTVLRNKFRNITTKITGNKYTHSMHLHVVNGV